MRSVGFSGEINRGIHLLGSEENDIIKQYPGKPKGRHFQSLLFSLILQPVRINKPGAPLLGLAKSIYWTKSSMSPVKWFLYLVLKSLAVTPMYVCLVLSSVTSAL